MTNRKKVILSFSVLIIIFIGLFLNKYFGSQVIEVNFNNVQEVYIYKASDYENKNFKAIKTIRVTGQSTRLDKGEYYLAWKTTSDYQEGNQGFVLKNKKESVQIDPKYSQTKLDSMLNDEINNINVALNAKFPTLTSLYIINKGSLYNTGLWYGTTLQYNGPDKNSADTLKVILKKESGTWKVITETPSLTFNRADYSQVPKDVLDNVNLYLSAPIQDKYTSE